MAAGVVCALLLVVRFVVLPQAASHRAEIADLLASRIGQPVEIDAIDTGWDGWNPRVSIRGLRVRERGSGAPLLELPRVDAIVAWTSLPLFDLRLRQLIVEGPTLAVRRDADGHIRVGGVTIDPARAAAETALTDWLLRQREIVVRDALVTWDDELRHRPQLVLDQVQFRLERSFRHHRFGLTGTPSVELAAPLDVRGDVVGLASSDWSRADGRFYVRLDYADVAAWSEWLPLPFAVASGEGALRLWVEMAQGQPRDVVADLELADVRARLRRDLPPLALRHVAGRLRWTQGGARHDVVTRAFGFRAADGATLPPTDLALTFEDAAGDRPAHGWLQFARLELDPLVAVAAGLPLPEALRSELARFAPRGTLVDGKLAWQGAAGRPDRFTASGRFERLGFRAQPPLPGVEGLTGTIDGTEAHGTIAVASHGVAIELPGILAEPVLLDAASGSVRWDRMQDALQIRVADAEFANGHAAGTAAGSWSSLPEGPGAVDMKAQLTRANFEHLHRYLPLKTPPQVRAWLARALQKGTSKDVRLVVAGNLADFPFPQGRNGRLAVAIKGQGGVLDYADHWPPVTDVDAEVRIDGTRIVVEAPAGRMLGAQIERVRVEIPDVRAGDPAMTLTGEAAGPTAEFLRFIGASPVADWIGHFTDGARATGSGRLALAFTLPFRRPEAATVAGEYRFDGNEVRLPGVPALERLAGKLAFTERSLTASDLTGEMLGGPLKLALAGGDGRVRVDASGTANLARLKSEIDSPLLTRVSGSVDWRAIADARPQAPATFTLESSLRGAAIDLPAPLGKTAAESVPLRIERREPPPGGNEELLTVDYGGAARALLRRPRASAAGYERALVLVGRAIERIGDAERPGLWLRAETTPLNLDAWLAFARALPPRSGAGRAAPLSFEGADIDAPTLQAMGRDIHDAKIVARRSGEDWRLALDLREGVGTAVWRAPTPVMPNGRIVARLSRMTTAKGSDGGAASAAPDDTSGGAGKPNPWPEIDLVADALYSKDRNLGKLEFSARPAGADWEIRTLALGNSAGSIKAAGWWRTAPPQQTKLDVVIDTQESGAFLSRFGMADTVLGAPTRIEGQLAWAGAPSDFDYATLTGTFRVASGAGQFLRADPGAGRLLGVLSLQALPRRMTLDYRDIFSDGFAFDSIDGDVKIASGVLATANLKMVGPAATIDIAGDVDLARETQQLRVRVQPSLSTSVSAGAAALFLANPVVGAVVGAGALLAQKILKDPIEQLFSYEYAISGGWSEPVVERVGRQTAALPPTSFPR